MGLDLPYRIHGHAGDQVHFARHEGGQPGRGSGMTRKITRLAGAGPLRPRAGRAAIVVIEALQHHVAAPHPLHQLEGARSDGVLDELVAYRLGTTM